MPKIILIAIFASAIAFGGCSNTPWSPDVTPELPPNVIYFQIRQGNTTLQDSVLSKISLYYLDENGNKISRYSAFDDTSFIDQLGRRTAGLENQGVLSSGYVDWILLKYPELQEIYLGYPDGDIDTLHIEIKKVEYEEAIHNRCYCSTPFTKVLFNGKDAPESADLQAADGKAVYLFQK